MTRVTAPMSTLARALATRTAVARPAYLGYARHTHNATPAPRTEVAAEREEPNRRFTTAHRPTPQPVPSRSRTVPLMQSFNFQTSTPQAARLDTSTIDYAVMPSLQEAPAVVGSIRVPLLPDNFFPDRANLDGHGPEQVDGPLAVPQISVVATHPENVTPASALTEVEPVGIDGVELKFAHSSSKDAPGESGLLQDLWKGLVDDVFGEKKATK